jgi:hypothetical protein
MFSSPTAVGQSLVLELLRIPVPPNKSRKDQKRKTSRPLAPNYHIPSFKNSKMLVSKTPQGRPLENPFLATKREFQEWMEKAVQSIESQLLSACQTGSDATPQVLSKLSAMLSLLPADDSVNDLVEGSWTVQFVPPGQEGAVVTLTRLS